jgi:hypothetical protein
MVVKIWRRASWTLCAMVLPRCDALERSSWPFGCGQSFRTSRTLRASVLPLSISPTHLLHSPRSEVGHELTVCAWQLILFIISVPSVCHYFLPVIMSFTSRFLQDMWKICTSLHYCDQKRGEAIPPSHSHGQECLVLTRLLSGTCPSRSISIPRVTKGVAAVVAASHVSDRLHSTRNR